MSDVTISPDLEERRLPTTPTNYIADAFSMIKLDVPEGKIMETLRPLLPKICLSLGTHDKSSTFLGSARSDLDIFLPLGPTLMIYAVLFDYKEVASLLIKTNPSAAFAPCTDRKDPLAVAASIGNIGMMKKLSMVDPGSVTVLPKTLPVNSWEPQSGFPKQKVKFDIGLALALAIVYGRDDAVAFLLDTYPETVSANSVIQVDGSKFLPLMYAAMNGRLSIAKMLIERDAMVNATDEYNSNALICAAQEGDIGIIDLLLLHDAEKDRIDTKGDSALSYAITMRRTEAAVRLIEKGARMYKINFEKSNAMILAVKANDLRVMEALHRRNFNVDDADTSGNTALIAAAATSKSKVVAALLDMDADTELKNTSGMNALMNAALHLNLPNVKLLLERRVSLQAEDLNKLSKHMDLLRSGFESSDVASISLCNDIMALIGNPAVVEGATANKTHDLSCVLREPAGPKKVVRY